jgi:3-dehydroquinate synthase
MINLNLKLDKSIDDSYSIIIGNGIIKGILHQKAKVINPSSAAFISDSNISFIYRDLIRSFKPGFPVCSLSYRPGEKSKNVKILMKLFRGLVKNKLDRKSLILAFGGGVTGDMAGFLASIYLRGIAFIQIPTSLLAMVDSSIGGKTGLDTGEGKNLIGRFYQPRAVIIDTDFLATLPASEFINGIAEVIKYSLIKDHQYFKFISDNRNEILSLDPAILLKLIETSCRIKASVVEADEYEASLRKVLNFGHTIGHAIERASGYSIPHGYAVAIGMIIEARISCGRNLLEPADLDKATELIKSYGLLRYAGRIRKMSSRFIYYNAKTDKKNESDQVRVIMLRSIGRAYNEGDNYAFPVSENEIKAGLEYLCDLTQT